MVKTNIGTQVSFDGGLNSRANVRSIETKESPDLSNVEFTKAGAVTKINGYTLYNSSPVSGSQKTMGIYNYVKSDGSVKRIVATTDGRLYTLSNGGAYTEIYSGLTSGKRVYFVTFYDLCIITNGYDAPLKYDGSTVSALLNWTDIELVGYPKFAAVWKNRLWFAGNPSNPFRLYESEPGDPEGWTVASGADALDIDINDGMVITGIAPFGDALMIYKKPASAFVYGGKVLRVVGTTKSDFVITPVDHGVAAINHNSIINIGRSTQLFIDIDGIYSVTPVNAFGDFKIDNISFKIRPSFDSINLAALDEAFAINFKKKGQGWFHIPVNASTRNNLCLVLDYDLGAWSKREGYYVSCGIEESGYPMLGDYTGNVEKHDFGGSYNSAAITSYWHSAWLAFGDATTTKRIRSIDFTLEEKGSYNLALNTYLNYQYKYFSNSFNLSLALQSGSSLWDVAQWDVGQWTEPQNKLTRTISGIGNIKSLAMKFSNNNANQPWTLLGWDIAWQKRGTRYGAPFP